MVRTIMVPLDGSTFAEHALPIALGLARECGGRVHLVQAHEPPPVPSSPDILIPYDGEWDAAMRGNERSYLDSVANRVAERAGVTVRTELLDGVPAMALAAYAREMELDLIVMTTHGRGGLSRMWLGSVADGVVRRSGVPVLVLRPTDEEVDYEARLTPRHILIPLDGSELSHGIIETAAWLGSLTGARLTLLRVTVPVPVLRAPGPLSDDGFAAKLVAEQEQHARAYLDRVSEGLRSRGLEVETAIVAHTSPASAVLEFAATNAVDLIGIATHGRGGWSRLALGSVADKVLRGSVIPVLLYRPPAVKVAEAAAAGSRNEQR
jgi:nucleotide-binding universal stress UspA family protein